MDIPLIEYLEILVMADNLSKVRREGFCYRNENRELPQFIADKINVNMDEFFNNYYNLERYS